MRKFYLENREGERISLFSEKIKLIEPSGLGISENRAYSELEYGFFGTETQEYTQPKITGTLVFPRAGQSPYKTYQEFVAWTEAAQEMSLVYIPYSSRELYMDVVLDDLELTEMQKYGALECAVVFSGTSPYHKQNPLAYTFRSHLTQKNPMKFTFSFTFQFSQGGADGAVVFSPQGHYAAALEAVINGPVSNPRLICTNANTGELYGDLDLKGVSVAEGDRVYYSSRPNADGVWKISGGIRTSLIESLNINNNNFIRIPAGTSCKAVLAVDIPPGVSRELVHSLYVHEYYKG